MKQKLSKCRVCRQPFARRSISHKACSVECSLILVDKDKERDRKRREATQRKQIAQRKEAVKSLSDIAADVQVVFNKYIRERDIAAGHGCISCGTKANVQYAAGHYRSRGASGALRFNEDNVFLQCNKTCNSEKSGNAIEMRKGMIQRIGIERVEAIENSNETKKWTREELYALKELYKTKLKELTDDWKR